MYRDPIVEEVRRIRHEIEQRQGGSPDAYYRYIAEVQRKHADRVVRLEPRPLKVGTAPAERE